MSEVLLSVLIPVYRYSVTQLVQQLIATCSSAGITYEIRIYDDASGSTFTAVNNNIADLTNVVYRELEQNVGRARIRNMLASESKGTWLLFLDCDMAIPDSNYIKRFVESMNNSEVLSGGTHYTPQPPENPLYQLHWLTGRVREQRSLEQRQKAPYAAFTLNNMCIPAKMYTDIGLDETLKGYGHEDSLFAFRLQQQHLPIRHIMNPVVHLGLNEAADFIAKCEQAAKNLAYINIHYGAGAETRLMRAYNRLHYWRLTRAFTTIISFLRNLLMYQLSGKEPILFFLDMLKLNSLVQAMRSNPLP